MVELFVVDAYGFGRCLLLGGGEGAHQSGKGGAYVTMSENLAAIAS